MPSKILWFTISRHGTVPSPPQTTGYPRMSLRRADSTKQWLQQLRSLGQKSRWQEAVQVLQVGLLRTWKFIFLKFLSDGLNRFGRQNPNFKCVDRIFEQSWSNWPWVWICNESRNWRQLIKLISSPTQLFLEFWDERSNGKMQWVYWMICSGMAPRRVGLKTIGHPSKHRWNYLYPKHEVALLWSLYTSK